MSADIMTDVMLDTNIVIYTVDTEDPNKTRRAEQLVKAGVDDGDCCVSRQVMQETLNVATKRFNYSKADARQLLERTLLPLYRPISAPPLYRRGLDIHFRYKYSFYDSLIIAAALELGCATLYSEDLQHGQSLGRLTIKNPFR